MIETSVLEQARHWGYVLLAPPHPDCAGHGGLVFALYEKPQGVFCEPESVELWLRDEQGLADRARLDHMRRPLDDRQICPGPVILCDWAGTRTHFLTFGGSLSLVVDGEPQIYALHSPAPILELGDPSEPDVAQLGIGAEALLSQAHARWRGDDEGFLYELAQVGPMVLYGATLHSLIADLEQSPALLEQSPELYTLLRRERRWLREAGYWPHPEMTLAQLLEPGPANGQEDR